MPSVPPASPAQTSLAVPLALLRCPEVSDAALRTWLLLYALADGAGGVPPLPRRELAQRVGKCESILNLHLARLRRAGVLNWQPAGAGRIRLSFPAQFHAVPSAAPADSEIPESSAAPRSESSQSAAGKPADPPSKTLVNRFAPVDYDKSERDLSLTLNPESLTPPEESRAAPFRQIKNPPDSPDAAAPPPTDALDAYRRVVGRRPNPAQRQLIQAQVRDLPRWQASLEHWLAHGWNPLNIPGMLELYARGGPAACTRCHPPGNPAQKPNPIQELIEKYADPRDA